MSKFKFKKGDRVMVVKDVELRGKNVKGFTGTVNEDNTRFPWVIFDEIIDMNYKKCNIYAVHQDKMEILSEEGEKVETKYLTNSELWRMAENNEIADGSRFLLEEDCEEQSIAMFYEDEGEFRWEENDYAVEFNRSDMWSQISSKPRMTKQQAEQEFGIEIID